MKTQILNLNTSFNHTGIIRHATNSDVVRVDEVVALSGGKGIDVARVFKKLGYNNYTVSNILGGNVGDLIEKKMNEENIKAWNFKIKNDSRINYAYVNEIEESILMINENGPLIEQREKEKYLEELNNWLVKGQILVIAGSATTGFVAKDIHSIIKMAKEKNMYVVIDTSKEYLSASLEENIDLLKINNKEFADQFKNYEYEFNNFKDYIDVIESEKIKEVIITFGKEGILSNFDGEIFFGKNKKVFSNYAIGSGDSFLAGYIYGEIYADNKEDTLKLAMACGAANTLEYGAGVLNKKDIDMMYDKNIIVEKMQRNDLDASISGS